MSRFASVPERKRESLVQALLRTVSGTWGFLVGNAVATLGIGLIASLAAALEAHRRRLKALYLAKKEWQRHIDLSVVQAILLSTERIRELGRVEKRTLFVKRLHEIFGNGYIRDKIVEVAQQAVEVGEPFFMKLLEPQDKWHVLVECMNHLSSLFAPYHIFFNEATRTQSNYRSAWYCFTLTCQRTEGPGRFFITPRSPVGGNDMGMLRIRIVLVSEKDLRDLASGSIESPEAGFFSSRHEGRWKVLSSFAHLFEMQLQRSGIIQERSGVGLGGRGLPNRLGSFGSCVDLRRAQGQPNSLEDTVDDDENKAEHNTFLRMHIPFPSSKASADPLDRKTPSSVLGAQDVVLFE